MPKPPRIILIEWLALCSAAGLTHVHGRRNQRNAQPVRAHHLALEGGASRGRPRRDGRVVSAVQGHAKRVFLETLAEIIAGHMQNLVRSVSEEVCAAQPLLVRPVL